MFQTSRFAKFLGLEESSNPVDDQGVDLCLENASSLQSLDDEDDEQFEMLLDELGIRSVIGSDDQVGLF